MSKNNEKITPTYQSDPGDETNNVEEEKQEQRVSVGLSPLGGIGLNVSDTSGTTSGVSLTIEEAEQLAGRLQGLATILLHMGYIEAAQQQLQAAELAKKIHLPGL